MTRPETIDRYEVREVLGTGATGSVYLAWDPKLHREVAIKVVAQDTSREGKWRERFQREARAVAALKHPNIVRDLRLLARFTRLF
ncbi:MAG: protein kinase [Myxococcota bacterium]